MSVGVESEVVAKGIIPQKVSDLENDVPFVSRDDLNEALGLSDGQGVPTVIAMIQKLTEPQKEELKEELGVSVKSVEAAQLPAKW